jgi:hypothetical protein
MFRDTSESVLQETRSCHPFWYEYVIIMDRSLKCEMLKRNRRDNAYEGSNDHKNRTLIKMQKLATTVLYTRITLSGLLHRWKDVTTYSVMTVLSIPDFVGIYERNIKNTVANMKNIFTGEGRNFEQNKNQCLKLVVCILLRVLGQVQGFRLTQHWFEYFIQ